MHAAPPAGGQPGDDRLAQQGVPEAHTARLGDEHVRRDGVSEHLLRLGLTEPERGSEIAPVEALAEQRQGVEVATHGARSGVECEDQDFVEVGRDAGLGVGETAGELLGEERVAVCEFADPVRVVAVQAGVQAPRERRHLEACEAAKLELDGGPTAQ